MIKPIIIAKAIIACVVWNIYIDKFHSSCITFQKGGNDKEVISTYNQIVFLSQRCYCFAINMFFIISLSSNKYFRGKQLINLIRSKGLIIKNFVPLLVFFCLPSFQYAVFMGEYQGYITRCCQIMFIIIR